ncbi:hypothetical protein [Novosphingobium rosa]|uniref:hypothetical protein n=1 Tax=Novosphingobium rosa TaxID=76978 RepID=UPI000B0C19E8|nr:hypothetical protein [Novosphingobium rosa]
MSLPPTHLTPLTPMPPTVVTLTPCWYARDHEPMEPPLDLAPGELAVDRCCHCHRPIVSADLRRWHIAGGFNMEAWGTPRSQPCLAVVDEQQERVIARFPIKDSSATGVNTLRARLRRDYHIDEPNSPFVLRDCLPPHLAQMAQSGGYGALY